MSILKSNNSSIDQQPFDEEWLEHSGINQWIKRDPEQIKYELSHRKPNDWNIYHGSIKDIFGMHIFIYSDKSAHVRTSYTPYFGNIFISEVLKTKGDVLRFLNCIHTIIGNSSK